MWDCQSTTQTGFAFGSDRSLSNCCFLPSMPLRFMLCNFPPFMRGNSRSSYGPNKAFHVRQLGRLRPVTTMIFNCSEKL